MISPSSAPRTIKLSRLRVGLIALGCLALAGILKFGTDPTERNELWIAAFARVGLVMSALWIALPTKRRPAAWADVSPSTLIGLALALLVFARSPRLLLHTLPLFAVLAVLNFILKRRPTSRDQRPDRDSWR